MADDAPGGSKRRVDMIRVERPQQVFDRDEVLGRDTSSVFPSETRRQAEQAGVDVADAMRAAIGGVRFITEKDVQEIKAKRGTSAEDEAAAVSSKPLAQILSEKREAKNEEFQEQWKIMKQGKNKPLEEDELAFLNEVEETRRMAERTIREQDDNEVLAFQLARESADLGPPPPPTQQQPSQLPKAGKAPARGAGGALGRATKRPRVVLRAKAAAKPPSAPATSPAPAPAPTPAVTGLAGLAAYDSDDSE